jgi:hypothetical protein
MGGAGVGDGERESGFVAAGMLGMNADVYATVSLCVRSVCAVGGMFLCVYSNSR